MRGLRREAPQAPHNNEQQTAAGSAIEQTAHLESWNAPVRKSLARFVGQTLSFSKSAVVHEAGLLLFLHRDNREGAIMLL